MKDSYYLILLFFISSCSTTKSLEFITLDRGNILYKTVEDTTAIAGREHDIVIYESKSRAKAKLDLDNTKLELKPNNLKNDFVLVDTVKTKIDLIKDTSGKLKLLDAYTYEKKFTLNSNEVGFIEFLVEGQQNKSLSTELQQLQLSAVKTFKELNKDNDYKASVALSYSDNKMVFQTLTIPFKIRSKNGDIPSTVSTNFNAGIAYGYQWNLFKTNPIYDENNSMAGYEMEKLSFAIAPFAGLTSVALKASNTDPDITADQTVMGFSFGAAGVFSFNRLNLGLALGIDHGFGNAENWIYQDKIWTGIVIGLDLIK